MKKVLFIAALALLSSSLYAQSQYAVEIKPGKKVIYVDQFDLPPSTPLSTLLDMFPELLAREGDSQLGNYDIQVDDVSMGVAKEIVMNHILLGDINKIEVSQNPGTSQQKNGQGGVLKVVLKPLEERVSGYAFMTLSSMADVMPGVKVNYKKDAWSLRSSLMMEYYHPFGEVTRRETVLPSVSTYQSDTASINNFVEMFTFDAVYQPNKADKLHLWATQSYSYDNQNRSTNVERNSRTSRNSSKQISKDLTFLAGANYAHTFDIVKLQGEATVERAPSKFSLLKYDEDARVPKNWWTLYDNSANTKVTGQVKGTFYLIPQGQPSKAELVTGVNCNYLPSTLDYDFTAIPRNGFSVPEQSAELVSQSSQLYVSPFIESNNEFGAWFLKGGVRYQYYTTRFNVNQYDPYSRPENHLTAFTNVGYQIAPHHHVSMILDRSIKRADNAMVFPYLVYDPMREDFVLGNPDILSTSYHNVALDYITDFERGLSAFTFNVGVKYINSSRLITTKYEPEYFTYINDGMGNTTVLDFLFLFSRGDFSLSFSANAFDNFKQVGKSIDSHKYFNLSLMPSLSLDKGWIVSGQIAYNSKVVKSNSVLGDYLYVWARLSKTWDKVTAFVQLDDCLHSVAEDVFFGNVVSEKLMYNLHRSNIGLGCFYSF